MSLTSIDMWMRPTSIDMWMSLSSIDMWMTLASIDMWMSLTSIDVWMCPTSIDMQMSLSVFENKYNSFLLFITFSSTVCLCYGRVNLVNVK